MKKKIIIIFCVFLVIVTIGLGFAINYLFNYAVVVGEKDFIKSEDRVKFEEKWTFAKNNQTQLTLKNDGLNLKARYVTHPNQVNKTVIIAHGYMSEGDSMGEYASYFYSLGYDVLVPDNRGHGKSEGDYIGFGWLDRLDYVKWIDQIITKKGQDEEILLFGISMGASTMMMTSGEKLPPQVKGIIADCGYDTVEHELNYQIKEIFNLPSFPLIPLTSIYSKMKVGYTFKEASAVEQLKKNKLPLLLIHGDKDDFVPTEFVFPLYEATQGPKELVLFEGAGHIMSYSTDKDKYESTIENFLKKNKL